MNQRRGDRIQGQRKLKGALTVPCLLNNKYHRVFLVDSGAAFTVISQQLAPEMKLEMVQATRKIQIVSAHQVAQTPVVQLDSLQVGDKKVNNLEVLIVA